MKKTVSSYARSLQIDLPSRKEAETFKWFLACLLFGKPIQTEIAEQAYRKLVAAQLTSPEAILRAGWDKLVALLDQAHYVRYDFSTATKLLEVCGELKQRYGTLSNLLAQAGTATQLSRALQEIKHIGPVTARIFLREIRPIWCRPSTPTGKRRPAFKMAAKVRVMAEPRIRRRQIMAGNAHPTVVKGRTFMEPAEKIDLNTASINHLTELPGIAVNVARRIVAYRRRHGGMIHDWDELLNVNGFPEDRMEEIKARATLGLPAGQRKPPQRAVLHRFPGQRGKGQNPK